MKELCADARARARALRLCPETAAAVVAAPHGVLPLGSPQRRSLLELLCQAPGPRAANTRFHNGKALMNLALLRGVNRRRLSAAGSEEWLPAQKERLAAEAVSAIALLRTKI